MRRSSVNCDILVNFIFKKCEKIFFFFVQSLDFLIMFYFESKLCCETGLFVFQSFKNVGS
jgi:hypothetical protein